ncbi:hypothetical protein B0T25DRAFT_569247 [Lasiosphaeria hispida]|uniref:Uncharacterized protein n=1 Tax=Lasiosphaeria hispida TaxID=260671 RepID=A0AAJ0HKJ7_9PEZI|nr:hypothetical protein B0T25DRAFT_569247 [Lasiosphaeria hispida]
MTSAAIPIVHLIAIAHPTTVIRLITTVHIATVHLIAIAHPITVVRLITTVHKRLEVPVGSYPHRRRPKAPVILRCLRCDSFLNEPFGLVKELLREEQGYKTAIDDICLLGNFDLYHTLIWN